MRAALFTADDFGMALEVNEAVEQASRAGVLTGASLLIAGTASADALRRARRSPQLEVGLHLATVGAPAAAPANEIPDLLEPGGVDLGQRPMRTGAAMALSRRLQSQIRRELVAQLDAARRSGLNIRHVDGHWHTHQHPQIVRMIVELAPEYGLRTVRWPREPASVAAAAAAGQGRLARTLDAVLHAPILAAMRRRLARGGLARNDWFFGKFDGGALTLERLCALVARLPSGITEFGLHPAARRWSGPHAPPSHWRSEAELAALVAPELRRCLAHHAVSLTSWSRLGA